MLIFLETALGLWSYEYVFECVGIAVVDFAAFADTGEDTGVHAGEHLLGLRDGYGDRELGVAGIVSRLCLFLLVEEELADGGDERAQEEGHEDGADDRCGTEEDADDDGGAVPCDTDGGLRDLLEF